MKPAGQSTRQMQERHHIRRMLIAGAILVVGVVFLLILGTIFGYVHNPVVLIGLLVGLLLVLKVAMPFLGRSGKNAKRMEGKAERGAIAEESIGDVLGNCQGTIWCYMTSEVNLAILTT